MSDGWAALSWWLAIQVLGWAVWPLAFRALRWLPDRGYMLAKPLGLLLVSYSVWLLGSFGLALNTQLGISLAAIGLILVSQWLYRRKGEAVSLRIVFKEQRKLFAAYELVFSVAFIAWAIFRAHAPDLITGEKPMEMAFLTAIGRTSSFPPPDPWLSGFTISYYYFGYVMMSLLGKVTGTSAGIAFSLSNALWFALSAATAFALVANLVLLTVQHARRAAIVVGLLGAILLVLIGNFEAPLEVARVAGLGSPQSWKQLDILDLNQPYMPVADQPRWPPRTGGFGWWWRASRVIHDYWPTTITAHLAAVTGLPPDSNTDYQELIDEFPQFSFLLGDMHPHVLDIPFVLLALGLVLNAFQAGATDAARSIGQLPMWLIYPLVLGGLGFVNTWDFPIYAFVAVTAVSFGRCLSRRFTWRSLVIDLLILGGLGGLLYLPFYRGFASQASGLSPNLFNGTSVLQFFVMFGPFIVIGMLLGVKLISVSIRSSDLRFPNYALKSIGGGLGLVLVAVGATAALAAILYHFSPAAITGLQNVTQLMADRGLTISAHLLARLLDPWLPLLLATGLAALFWLWRARSTKAPAPILFIGLLVTAGLLLALAPEFVYVTDVTGTRMNTVFKFYYQTWIMWSVVSAYAIYYLLAGPQRVKSRLGRTLTAIVITMTLGLGLMYPALALPSRVSEIDATAPGLDGTVAAAARDSKIADLNAAVQWFDEHVFGSPTVLVTTDDVLWFEPERSRVSSWTGLPTVLGWFDHETQWRGSEAVQRQRLPDIQKIYSTTNQQAALDLLRHYQVTYVYVGYEERQHYPAEGLAKFDRMLPVVFRQNGVVIYQVP